MVAEAVAETTQRAEVPLTFPDGDPARLGYARVSTDGQDESLQLDALAAAGCGRIWVDHLSGTLADRPGFDALRTQLRRGDRLVVWRLDRAGRSTQHLLELAVELAAAGVELVSLRESIDTSTPGGRLVFTVFAALAEFERDLVRERTIAGLAAARARGAAIGRPIVVGPDKLRAARSLLASGSTVKAAADAIGVSRASLYRAFNREGAVR